jgi:hypothetical protein
MRAFRGGAALAEILAEAETEAGAWLARLLAGDDELEGRIAEYVSFRDELAVSIRDELLRTEDEALHDLAELGDVEVRRYGTRSADHHQSSRVMVATVETLTKLTCEPLGVEFNADPQSRALILRGSGVWVSPRRLDGALPTLLNPAAIWEIKEYWGKTKGGARCQMRSMRSS